MGNEAGSKGIVSSQIEVWKPYRLSEFQIAESGIRSERCSEKPKNLKSNSRKRMISGLEIPRGYPYKMEANDSEKLCG